MRKRVELTLNVRKKRHDLMSLSLRMSLILLTLLGRKDQKLRYQLTFCSDSLFHFLPLTFLPLFTAG